jgi:hypothetical protein
MAKTKTHKHLHVKIPLELHGYLKELAEPYGGWKGWLKNTQEDFRKCRERVSFLEQKNEFLEARLKDANVMIKKLLPYAPEEMKP